MSNHDENTTIETESEPTRATRRTVLRGAGVAGLLTMGVGTASAQRGRQAQQQAAARGKGPTLPPQASQRAKDIIDIKFPGKDDGGNGGDDGSGGIDG